MGLLTATAMINFDFIYADVTLHEGSPQFNGSVVHRFSIVAPDDISERALWGRARRHLGLSGQRGRFVNDETWMANGSTMALFIGYL
tara:strand:- start:946 stop:1206 length:261 start_codon:yes stop_codon:yes gene_type:complete